MQVTEKVYLIARPGSKYNTETYTYDDTVEYTVWPHEKYSESSAVASLEVTFEVPDGINAKDLKLAELYAERTKVMAELQNRITQINGQISQLTAIEGTVTNLTKAEDDIPF